MAALGVFGLCQIHAFVDYLRSKLNPQQFEILFRSVISLVGFVLLTIGAVLMLTGSLRSTFHHQLLSVLFQSSRRGGQDLPRFVRRNSSKMVLFFPRENLPVDRALLLPAGPFLCKEQHPHHRLRL